MSSLMETQLMERLPDVANTLSINEGAQAITGHRVELQLLTTLKCNLKCSYCSLGVGEVLGSQRQIGY